MLVSLSTIINSHIAMKELGAVQLPGNISFRNKKFFEEYQTTVERFSKVQRALLEKLGEKDDSGNYDIPQPGHPNFPIYSSEMELILKEEVELPTPSITEADIGKEKFSPGAALILDWVFNPKKIEAAPVAGEVTPYTPETQTEAA